MKLYSFSQVVKELGIPYSRLYWATITHKVPEPIKVNKARVYSRKDINILRAYFDAKQKGVKI